MFNWDDKNFYKLLLENYHEEDFRACDILDCAEYKKAMREIRKLQKKMLEQYPDCLDDLNDLGDLYHSLNEVKDHYFFEEGVMFAFNMLMPRLLSREFFKMDTFLTERLTKTNCPVSSEDLDEDFDDENDDEEEDE